MDELCDQVEDSEQRDALIDASKCLDTVSLNDKMFESSHETSCRKKEKGGNRKKSQQLDDEELNLWNITIH